MKKAIIILAWVAVVGLAVHLRTNGLFRGLSTEGIYHPDEPKQVVALWRYMNSQYVWHIGSIYYDGYPYGLNHLDEWVLRPAWYGWKILSRHMAPDSTVPEVPEVSTLFYLSRALRVVYGMLCMIILLLVARWMSFSRSAAWYMTLLFAVAPISIAVAHFATGDIGTDLFTMLVLLFLCLYSQKHNAPWLFLAGLAVGMAFACKYNGLLCGVAPGAYILYRLVTSRDWKRFVVSGLNLAAGTVLGILILTPALLLDWDRAGSDIYANFAFIREFGAGEWYRQKSAFEKVVYILTANLPRIVGHLGWYVVIAGLWGTIVAARRKAALEFSVFVFPFIALAVSLAGKPEVQPFHFSYLQMPLIISAVYGVGWLGDQANRFLTRLLIILFMVIMVLEPGLRSKRDAFFWARQDNNFIQHRMPEIVFTDEGRHLGSESHIKDIFLEPENAAVFRNRRKKLELSGGGFWKALRVAPVPSIPYPEESDWIFANGPVFPRNDRMFKVSKSTRSVKQVVFYDEVRAVEFGVRSGSWPVEVHCRVGGAKETLSLQPNSSGLLSIFPGKYRRVDSRGDFDRDVYIVELEVEAFVGDAYITVFGHEEDINAFVMFNGETGKDTFAPPAEFSRSYIVDQVSRTRYVERADSVVCVLDGSDRTMRECVFPAGTQHEPRSFPLPCGMFVFECEVSVESDQAEVLMHVDDAYRYGMMVQERQWIKLNAGHNNIKYAFSKTFAPYQCRIVMTCLDGKVRTGDWKLRPDTAGILEAFEDWHSSGKRPSWLVKQGGVQYAGPDVQAGRKDIVFGGGLELKYFEFPQMLKPGEEVKVDCRMELVKYPFSNYGEHFVFVHMLDSKGSQVFAGGFPVAEAVMNQAVGTAIKCGKLDNVDPGEYHVEIGAWNGRTGKRLKVSAGGLSRDERKKRKIHLCKTRVVK